MSRPSTATATSSRLKKFCSWPRATSCWTSSTAMICSSVMRLTSGCSVARRTERRRSSRFARHRSAAVPGLWPWQNEVLTAYAGTSGAAAVELPTGTRRPSSAWLPASIFREGKGGRVTYLADDRQLVQQVERHGRDLGFPIVRFQGAKDSWSASGVRAFNFAEAIGVMKYWNYFNASPGVEPAGMLILNDVRLLEGPLRDLFSVFISRRGTLYTEILKLIVACDPYYSLTEDLLNGLEPMRAPEMLVSPTVPRSPTRCATAGAHVVWTSGLASGTASARDL